MKIDGCGGSGSDATHVATSIAEGTELVRELTKGVMADSALRTVGLVRAVR